MKSWKGEIVDETLEHPRRPSRTDVRWRALGLTLGTVALIQGAVYMYSINERSILGSLHHLGWQPHEFGNSESVILPDSAPRNPFEPYWDWSKINPSEDLDWHDCYTTPGWKGLGLQCAKLSLPLDYFNGTYPDKTISIAITKLPARVPVNDPRYGGPILLNPGGPGGSGTFFAVVLARNLQQIVDSAEPPCRSAQSTNAKYYDIIGFDPRGIGESEPAALCMPDIPSAWSWSLREQNEGILDSSDAALGRLWSMTHAYGTSCKASEDEDGPDIKQYLTTASVARDMLEITEKHAQWVAESSEELSSYDVENSRPLIEYKPGQAQLQYWGFSYGTYLGSTFASMFPDRVGRVILDGVVSAWDYNHMLGNGSLTDTEKTMRSFYTYCYNVGPELCLQASDNSTIDDIAERFSKIVTSLYHNPIPILTDEGPEIFTYSDLKKIIFSSLYQPNPIFFYISLILADVEARQGRVLKGIVQAFRPQHIYECPRFGDPPPSKLTNLVPQTAILCGDGFDQTSLTSSEFEDYLDLLKSLSPTAGAIWAQIGMRCAAWPIRPLHSFRGPHGAPKTLNPILFISNTADPVTPLRSGRLMHSKYPGSGLLISDTAGHCSLTSVNSCAYAHVRAYFQTGKLPTPGDTGATVCAPPPSPYSLNSTDPGSPFYDPSLGTADNLSLFGSEFWIEEEHGREVSSLELKALESVGQKVADVLETSEEFGFRKMVGSGKFEFDWESIMYAIEDESWIASNE